MDLDEEATRRINGSDKDVGSIDKDIERCEQLIKPEHANWIGLSNQSAIEHLIKEYKELEEENAMLKEIDKITENITTEEIENAIKEADKNFIPVSLVEEKIKELENKIKESKADYLTYIEYCEDRISALQELLDGK